MNYLFNSGYAPDKPRAVMYTDGSWLLHLREGQCSYVCRDTMGLTLQGDRSSTLRELRDLLNEALKAEEDEAVATADFEPEPEEPVGVEDEVLVQQAPCIDDDGLDYIVHDVNSDPLQNIVIGRFLQEFDAEAFLQKRQSSAFARQYAISRTLEEASTKHT